MKRYAIVLLTLILVGCAALQQMPTMHIRAPFDSEAAKRLLADGPNTVKGNGFIRQQGGGLVTCAGQNAYLAPVTSYASERVLALYGSTERGLNERTVYRFIPDPPDYVALMRKTRCDSQGNFVFERVADGDFYVNVSVFWMAGKSRQGGQLIQRISVHGGQTLSVVLAP